MTNYTGISQIRDNLDLKMFKNSLNGARTHKKIVSNLEFLPCTFSNEGIFPTQKKLNRQSARRSMEMIKCQAKVEKIW